MSTDTRMEHALELIRRRAGQGCLFCGSVPPRRQDNLKLRELMALPPIVESNCTALVCVEIPPQKQETCDLELDAALWLQELARTGDPALLAKAKERWPKIKSTPEELGKRLARSILEKTGDQFSAMFAFRRFESSLDQITERAVGDHRKRAVAIARMGGSEEAVYADTQAETWCKKVLHRCRKSTDPHAFSDELDSAHAAKRFKKHADLMPWTLDDCIHELRYWDELYQLRNDVGSWEDWAETQARMEFIRQQMAEIPPRDSDEGVRVFEFLINDERYDMDQKEMWPIIRNLITGRTS